MTISNTDQRDQVVADGIETVYPFSFRVDRTKDFQVWFDDVQQTYGSSYAIEDEDQLGVATGGNIETVLVLDANIVITIMRVVVIDQETDYTPYDPFPAETHELALDHGIMIDQQLQETLNRSMQIAAYVTPPISNAMPDYESGKVLGWDAVQRKLINTMLIAGVPTGNLPVIPISDYDSLNEAVADIGSTPATLMWDSIIPATSDVVTPSNLFLYFPSPLYAMTQDTDVTITVYNPENIIASRRQGVISSANNTVDPLLFTTPGIVSIEWWGTDSVALRMALTASAMIKLYSDMTFVADQTGPRQSMGGSIRASKTAATLVDNLYLDGDGHTISIAADTVTSHINSVFAGSESGAIDNITAKNIHFTKYGSFGIDSTAGFNFFNNAKITLHSISKSSLISSIFWAAGCVSANVSNIKLLDDFGSLGWMVFCSGWNISNIYSDKSDELIDMDLMNSDITINGVTVVGSASILNNEIFDINACQRITISNVSVSNIRRFTTVNVKDDYETWADYVLGLDGGGNTSLRPGTDIVFNNITGYNLSNSGFNIGNTVNRGGTVARVFLNNVSLDTLASKGLEVQECDGLFLDNVFIKNPASFGISMYRATGDANSILKVQMNNVRIVNTPQEGIHINRANEVLINNLTIDTANTGDGNDPHLSIVGIDDADSRVQIDNYHAIAGPDGFRALNFHNNDANSQIQVGRLNIDGTFSDANINFAAGHAGIRGMRDVCKLGNSVAGTDEEWPVLVTPGVHGSHIMRVWLVNGADITQNDTDYITFRVRNKGSAGTSNINLFAASPNTRVTPIGAELNLDIDEFLAMDLVVDQALDVDVENILSFVKEATNAGKALTDAMLYIEYIPY